jgi:hypothetical protein
LHASIVNVGHGYIGAVLRKPKRNGMADPAIGASARYDSDFAGQVKEHVLHLKPRSIIGHFLNSCLNCI